MSKTSFSLLLSLTLISSFTIHSEVLTNPPSLYLSSTTFLPNYQKMIRNFKIYIHKPNEPFTFNSPSESFFYTALQNSPYVTQNPEEAHLFFIPFPSNYSTRSIARLVRNLRIQSPHWNRALGADHFYVSCSGIGYESDRNILELKKNAIQISCFPTLSGNFVPHKDISLPPVATINAPHAPSNRSLNFLGFLRNKGVKESTLAKELRIDPDFLVESEPSDQLKYAERLSRSEFCLFDYGVDVSGIGEALRFGCVPVVITDRAIQELPFIDVLRWQEMAILVRREGGVKELKRVMKSTRGDRYDRMRRLCVMASQHFVWNESPKPLDCFNTLMYQMWLRRHTIRYVQRE